MSDVIQSVGPYRDFSGRRCEVKCIDRGFALGFDGDGDPSWWTCDYGHWQNISDPDSRLNITGPWIPDPPEPPAGFVVMPKDYVAKDGDKLTGSNWTSGWQPVADCFGGMSAADIEATYTSSGTHYIASPIPKPFSISEHGPGVYERADGKEIAVTAIPEEQFRTGLSRDFSWWSENEADAWRDDGTWELAGTKSCPQLNLVRYLRPLPKPTVDPGEGWRLLGDEEVISAGDEYYCGGGLKRWTSLNGAEPTGQTVAQSDLWWQQSYKPVFYRRRVTPLAPQEEWTPTNELRWKRPSTGWGSLTAAGAQMLNTLEQKWTCGEKSEWRAIEVTP